jgi:phosphoglucomutase
MTNNPIKFGTSGWRGIIADDFTAANVRLAAAAIAQYLLSKKGRPHVIVGYDTRFMSERFADAAAETLASHGLEVFACSRPDPTPAISHEILHRRHDGGINMTASHNPAEYHGLKFSSADGAPALPEVTKEIERLVGRILEGEFSVKGPKFAAPLRHPADPRPAYLENLRSKVDLRAIAAVKLKIAYDPLYGTARGYLNDLLEEAGANITTIHDFRDVMFSGAGPEPSEQNLAELVQLVREKKYDVGLSTDGDADRFGVVDADGTWIQPNYVLALLADYLIEVKKVPGGIGRSVATTHLMDAVARHHGVPVYETPVGFKYVGELIKQDKIALGGEESAGLSIRGHLPEKDGVLACLLVAEAVARRGRTVKQQLEDLFKKVGAFYPVRVNLHLKPEVQKKLAEKLKRDYDKFDSRKVVRTDRTDGLKMICDDGSWVLMRPSGTEPVVRLYCEASSEADRDRLVKAAREFIEKT